MSNTITERLIVLKKIKYGEADLIIQALSEKSGKVSLIARAALKSKKRFGGGVLEPTHVIRAHYKKSHEVSRLAVLQEAELLHGFDNLRLDYEILNQALHVVEIINKVSQEGEVHSESLFDLAGHALQALSQATYLPHFKLHFGLRLLLQQGVLEQESWMLPFLKTPMAKTNELQKIEVNSDAEEYIKRNLARLGQ
jgi:DNA repair protein RecO (recombination protein O)